MTGASIGGNSFTPTKGEQFGLRGGYNYNYRESGSPVTRPRETSLLGRSQTNPPTVAATHYESNQMNMAAQSMPNINQTIKWSKMLERNASPPVQAPPKFVRDTLKVADINCGVNMGKWERNGTETLVDNV